MIYAIFVSQCREKYVFANVSSVCNSGYYQEISVWVAGLEPEFLYILSFWFKYFCFQVHVTLGTKEAYVIFLWCWDQPSGRRL